MTDKLSKREIFLNCVAILVVIFIIGKLFYGTFWAGLLLLPLGVLIFKERKRHILEKKTRILEIQFKDMLMALSDSISAGYSIQNAIKEAYRDMVNIYGKTSRICDEMRRIISGLELNVTIERTIKDMAQRVQIPNVSLFANILCVAKQTGGSIPEIIKNVTDEIILKENVKQEIEAAITEKKLEQRVMTIIPIFLIVYVSFASPGFLDVMYKSIAGKFIMTICIVLYFVAYIWGEKLVEMRNGL